MRLPIFIFFFGLAVIPVWGNTKHEIRTVTLPDGEQIQTRLSLPEDGPISTLVLCIHGTGPGTYLTQRNGFNYFDILADGFTDQGVGFFTYNRRGVDLGQTPPWYDTVDRVKYTKYTPLTEAEDVEQMVRQLRADPRFGQAKILLYGISEGTIIAAMVAERRNVVVDGILLHGYAHENLADIIEWQNSGAGVMIMANSVFDTDGDQKISREEFEADNAEAKAYRSYLFQNVDFDSFDVVRDGVIDVQDMRKFRMAFHEILMEKTREGDDDWIWNTYFRITSRWLKEHFTLEANKTRLLRVDIPVHIFHGTIDANVPVEGVYDMEKRFRINNKTNLTVHVFEKHGHDLNISEWLKHQKMSEGMTAIFETAAEF